MKSAQLSRRPTASGEVLQSRHHPLLKKIRAIVRSGELLDEDHVLLETSRLIEDARACGIPIRTVITRDPLSAEASELLEKLPHATPVIRVPAAMFASLTSIEAAPGAIALAEAPKWNAEQVLANASFLLVVAGVQDPGNLGTMLRTAEAFGISGAILTQGTVSPWNAKAFRASAGSAMRIPTLRNFSSAQTVQLLRDRRIRLYGAVVRGGLAASEIDSQGSVAVAIGAETAGLPAEIERACEPVSIPMAARVDSLNAAAATAIILYELSRQRAGH